MNKVKNKRRQGMSGHVRSGQVRSRQYSSQAGSKALVAVASGTYVLSMMLDNHTILHVRFISSSTGAATRPGAGYVAGPGMLGPARSTYGAMSCPSCPPGQSPHSILTAMDCVSGPRYGVWYSSGHP